VGVIANEGSNPSPPLRRQKDYNPLRQGIVMCRDPGGFCLYVVAVRNTVVASPYYTAGVSSLAGRFGYKHNEVLAAPSWGVGLERNEP
jgi:hypothetical protein